MTKYKPTPKYPNVAQRVLGDDFWDDIGKNVWSWLLKSVVKISLPTPSQE